MKKRPSNCECDNTHEQNNTCCMPCWNKGFRTVNQPYQPIITLRKLAINLRFSQETTMFQAEILVDGKKAGYAQNDGHGGDTYYHAAEGQTDLLNKAEKFCEGLPDKTITFKGAEPFTVKMNLERFIDDLVEEACVAKETKAFAAKLAKDCLKGICYGTPTAYRRISWNLPIAAMKLSEQGRNVLAKKIAELKAQGANILNTNLEIPN